MKYFICSCNKVFKYETGERNLFKTEIYFYNWKTGKKETNCPNCSKNLNDLYYKRQDTKK